MTELQCPGEKNVKRHAMAAAKFHQQVNKEELKAGGENPRRYRSVACPDTAAAGTEACIVSIFALGWEASSIETASEIAAPR